jgi:hypothetical protein
MTKEAAAISRKEQISLWHAKTLFNKLQGDSAFAPHALAAMARDPFQDSRGNSNNGQETNVNSKQLSTENQSGTKSQETIPTAEDIAMENVEYTNGIDVEEHGSDSVAKTPNGVRVATTNGTGETKVDNSRTNGDHPASPAGDDGSDTASQLTAHRMTTRARAQAASTPSPPSTPSSTINAIHPFFKFAVDSLPDRDFGLPAAEAEDTRMLLMAYVQKQEEISRVATEMYHGLLQGERMRQDVFKWAKAEAHVGEMSDGEDWYDREEWGLDEDLVKGRDEDEDDTAVAGKKSTRQRRKPDKEDR